MNGTDLLIYVGGVAVGHSTSSSININADMIDATTKGSAGWKDVLPGLKDWSMDVEGLVDYGQVEGFSECFANVANGTQIVAKFGTEVTGDVRYTGNAYVSSLSQSAPMEDVVTYSFTLTGDGALAEETVT
jgi:predicted secreted protein